MVRFHEYEHHGPNRIKCQFEQCTCEYKKLTFVVDVGVAAAADVLG